MSKSNYVIRLLDSVLQLEPASWNRLLAQQDHPTPFMRYEYLAALESSGCATPQTGWSPRFLTLSTSEGELQAACPLYLKNHSRGEYVFDWAWAGAYERHGLPYYPKGVVAVPFTPVSGSRLLARDGIARQALLDVMLDLSRHARLSSLHLLFGMPQDMAAAQRAGMMQRHDVQFHWCNSDSGYSDFDAFLADLNQEKRKKIRQERRKVEQAGVSFRARLGHDITQQDWDFFYRCYERTYLEHGQTPYLNREFFAQMASQMPEHWLLFVAQRGGMDIAASLIGVTAASEEQAPRLAWGRYWGALERVDCLHFEACYYQPLAWCITHGYHRFEGGAQGEHKLARALLPVRTDSAHWLEHPDFSNAIGDYLARERPGVDAYLQALSQHSPMKKTDRP